MAQAIIGHSGVLAGRSISYYSMKFKFSLQSSTSHPQKGTPALPFELRGGQRWGSKAAPCLLDVCIKQNSTDKVFPVCR